MREGGSKYSGSVFEERRLVLVNPRLEWGKMFSCEGDGREREGLCLRRLRVSLLLHTLVVKRE